MLLARALARVDDAAGAAAQRRQAWEDYRSAPAFQRRDQRLWAYRAQPWRAIPWLAGLVVVIAAVLGLEGQLSRLKKGLIARLLRNLCPASLELFGRPEPAGLRDSSVSTIL